MRLNLRTVARCSLRRSDSDVGGLFVHQQRHSSPFDKLQTPFPSRRSSALWFLIAANESYQCTTILLREKDGRPPRSILSIFVFTSATFYIRHQHRFVVQEQSSAAFRS